MKLSKAILTVLIGVMVLGWTVTGCKSKDKTPKNRTLHGTIATIDAASGTVGMNWFNEKLGKTMIVAGKVNKETEIYIDGKLGDISQMKENDEVSVEGYKKGTDVVAIKIIITRESGESRQIKKPVPTTKPTDAG